MTFKLALTMLIIMSAILLACIAFNLIIAAILAAGQVGYFFSETWYAWEREKANRK